MAGRILFPLFTLLALFAFALLAGDASAEPGEPAGVVGFVELAGEAPPGARVQRVADDLVLNGRHCQVFRMDMAGTEQAALDFYRARFGARHVEARVMGARVVAARQGDRFVTVRLRPRGAATVEATLIATRIDQGSSVDATTLETRALLPASTVVLQTQEASDGGASSSMLVAANQRSVRVNRDAIVEQLRARGFRVVGEDSRQFEGRESLSLMLASASEDAAITVTDAGAYRSLLIQRSRRRP